MKYPVLPLIIVALTIVAACFGAFLLITMGLDYMNPEIGRGLHPLLAFPLATLLLSAIGVIVFLCISIQDAPYDSDQENAVIALSKDGIYLAPFPKLDK